MNERIRELAEQAAENTRLQHNNAYWRMQDELAEDATWREKFAELIVKECANHCDLLLDHKISSEWSRGTHDCSRAIKKHFGVE